MRRHARYIRARHQAASVARNIRHARHVVGLSSGEAAARAGVARSTLERIEQGQSHVTLSALTAAADAVGLDLVVQAYPRREPRLRDSGQLDVAQRLCAVSHPA